MAEIHDDIVCASPGLHPTTISVLADMYGSNSLWGTESHELIAIDKGTRIGIQQGAMINKIMRDNSVVRSLEVGFAYGFSTVWMLDALRSQNGSLHIAVDPYQKSNWQGIGLSQVARLGYEIHFEWLQEFSIHALSDLIRKNEKFEFIYIDGNHRFDDVIVDFYLSDQVLSAGGIIALDDMWMDSIQAAVRFIINNRAYEKIAQPVYNLTLLRKIRDDDRPWTHFNGFDNEKHGKHPDLYKSIMKCIKRLYGDNS